MKKPIRNRGKSVYIQTVLYIVSLIFFIVFIGGVFYYMWVSKYMQQELNKSNESMIRKTASSYEVFLDNTIHIILLHLNDNHVKAGENERNYSVQVFNHIDNIAKLSDYIHSIYYFDYAPQTIYLSEGISFDYGEFYDQQWVSSLDIKSGISILPARKMPTLSGDEKEIVPILINYPFTALEPLCSYVINLDAASFFEHIIANIHEEDGYKFTIAEENGMVFIATDKEYTFMNIQDIPYLTKHHEDILKEDSGQFVASDKNNKKLVSYFSSHKYNWIYISELDYEAVEASLKRPLYTVLLFSFILFIISLAAGLIFSNRLYKPLKELMQSFSLNKGKNKEKSEFEIVTDFMMRFIDENQNLKDRLELHRINMQKQFLYKMLTRNTFETSEIDEYFSDIGIDAKGYYVVSLFEIREYKDLLNEIAFKDWTLWEFSFENIALEVGQRFGTPLFVSMESNRFAVIMRFEISYNEEKAEKRTIQVVEEIIKAMKLYLKFNFVAGVSSACTNIYDIHQYYVQAVTALRLNNLSTGVISYRHFGQVPLEPAISPRDEDSMSKRILIGDEVETVRIMYHMYESYSSSQTATAFSVPYFSFQILSIIMKFIIEFELSEEEVLYQNNNYANTCLLLAASGDEKDSLQILSESLTALCQKINIKRNNISDVQLLKIVNYIQENYAKSISLDSISDYTGFSKNLISKLIKDHFNTSVVNYVNNIRIEKAIDLIRNTDQKVYEIAEAVGFHNTHYFIKVFKKFTNTTPGQMIEDKLKND